MCIVIDPGHGGLSAVGGSSPNNAQGTAGLLEKDVALEVGLFAAKKLRQMGYEVHLTRETDTNLGLQDRAKVAKSKAAKAFVSIHFNGDNNPSIQGTETWIYTVHSQDSALLATSVQSHVKAATGYRNRGVKKGNLGVIRFDYHDLGTSACLAEISFITDPADEARLKVPPYTENVGKALAQGIDDFVRGVCTEPAPISDEDVPVEDGDI